MLFPPKGLEFVVPNPTLLVLVVLKGEEALLVGLVLFWRDVNEVVGEFAGLLKVLVPEREKGDEEGCWVILPKLGFENAVLLEFVFLPVPFIKLILN